MTTPHTLFTTLKTRVFHTPWSLVKALSYGVAAVLVVGATAGVIAATHTGTQAAPLPTVTLTPITTTDTPTPTTTPAPKPTTTPTTAPAPKPTTAPAPAPAPKPAAKPAAKPAPAPAPKPAAKPAPAPAPKPAAKPAPAPAPKPAPAPAPKPAPAPAPAPADLWVGSTHITGGTPAQRQVVAGVVSSYASWVSIPQIRLLPRAQVGYSGATLYVCRTQEIQLASDLTGAALRQAAAHETAHAIQNTVYGAAAATCLYNQTSLLAPFGGYERFTDCMVQAMTGSNAYLHGYPACTPTETAKARTVVNGQKI